VIKEDEKTALMQKGMSNIFLISYFCLILLKKIFFVKIRHQKTKNSLRHSVNVRWLLIAENSTAMLHFLKKRLLKELSLFYIYNSSNFV